MSEKMARISLSVGIGIAFFGAGFLLAKDDWTAALAVVVSGIGLILAKDSLHSEKLHD